MTYDEAWLAQQLQKPGYHVVGAPAPALPEDTPEDGFLARIRSLACPYGWETYHTYSSRRSEPGFPDLVLCNGTDLLLYELKTNTGKATMAQQRWLSLLMRTGCVETGIWRPRDWPDIAARLTRRREA